MTAPSLFVPPTTSLAPEWIRKAASAINWLLANTGSGGGSSAILELDGGVATSTGTPGIIVDGGTA